MAQTELTSQMTFFYKKILPALWAAFLTIFIVNATQQEDQSDFALKLVFVLVLAVASYFLLFKTFFNFADVVLDQGDALVIINNNKKSHIALNEIQTIIYAHDGNPPKVSLVLKDHSKEDKPISFMPTTETGPFKKNQKITNLINRVEKLQNT